MTTLKRFVSAACYATAAIGATLGSTLAVTLASTSVLAQTASANWPTKQIRLVVAFSAGGTADIFARLIGPDLSAALGQQVIVENRPGSAGATGSSVVSNAEADGHTLLMCGSGPQITAPIINPNVGYDPVRDFTHLAMVAGDGYVLIANADQAITSVAQLKASGRTAITTGSPGTASLGHLLIEQVKRRTGLDLLHVPYKSSGDGIKDLLGNHIGLVMSPVVNASEQIRSGKVASIGLTAPERNAALPGVATFKEQGYDVNGLTWFWLCGPKNLPAPIATRLSGEVRRIVKLPNIKRVLDRDALVTPDLEPAKVTEFVAAEIAQWTPLIKEIGLKMQ
jgi:tripartite-type tricarboxylate transporter receptor subunit TctC